VGIGWLYLKLVVWSLGGFQGGYWGWWKSRGKGGGKMVSGVGKNAGGVGWCGGEWGGVFRAWRRGSGKSLFGYRR